MRLESNVVLNLPDGADVHFFESRNRELIEFQSVSKFYKTVVGLNDVNLKLEPGAYGLLGPNGSGKTTLINLIMGQLVPSIGEILIFGRSPTKDDSILRRIGLCPAVEPFYFNLSGLRWVTYLTQLHGFSRREAQQKAEGALDRVGMTEAMHRPMSGYSLGMRQRCKLAQAIAHEPELLILDEPFNGLDPVGRIQMTDYLRQWVRQGRSVILASHVLHEVEAIQPSFLLISGGRLLASGSPAEVRQLMSDCPNTVEIHCNDAARLGSELLHRTEVERLELTDSRDQLVVHTRRFADLSQTLSEISAEDGIQIYQLSSSDESLQDLFTNLLKRHRGEL